MCSSWNYEIGISVLFWLGQIPLALLISKINMQRKMSRVRLRTLCALPLTSYAACLGSALREGKGDLGFIAVTLHKGYNLGM